jgi:hypothetical protein
MENVSIEDVNVDGPSGGVRPKAGDEGIADDGGVDSVIGANDILRIDPTTDFVCEGDIVSTKGSTGRRGGEGIK